jgi:hypothetical protein
LDPAGAKRAQAALEDLQASLAVKKAQAANYQANAGQSAAAAVGERQKNEARGILGNPKATPEEISRATEVLSGGRTALNQKKDEFTLIKGLYKEMNPGVSDAEAATFALDYNSAAKGQDVRGAHLIIQQGDQNSPIYKAAMELVGADINRALASRQASSGKSTTDRTQKTSPGADPRAMATSGDAATRFAADPAVKGMTLGTQTPQGYEVKNSAGKLVGYYK